MKENHTQAEVFLNPDGSIKYNNDSYTLQQLEDNSHALKHVIEAAEKSGLISHDQALAMKNKHSRLSPYLL